MALARRHDPPGLLCARVLAIPQKYDILYSSGRI